MEDLVKGGCSEEVVLLGILRLVEEIQQMSFNIHGINDDTTIVINGLFPFMKNREGILGMVGGLHYDHKHRHQRLDVDANVDAVAVENEVHLLERRLKHHHNDDDTNTNVNTPPYNDYDWKNLPHAAK